MTASMLPSPFVPAHPRRAGVAMRGVLDRRGQGSSRTSTLSDGSIRTLDPVIARAQEGDETAFQELFLAHRETVARVVHRIMGPSADVEDVVQDVFIHVFRSIRSFRGDSKFSTWLYRLSANVTKMHLRKKSSRPRTVDVPVPEQRSEDAPVETPDLALDRQRRIDALYRLIDRLSEKKRVVLVLHDLEGLTAAEISERVDAPVMTVRTRLFYARKELYAALAEEPSLAQVVDRLMEDLPGRPAGKSIGSTPDKPKLHLSSSKSSESSNPSQREARREPTTKEGARASRYPG